MKTSLLLWLHRQGCQVTCGASDIYITQYGSTVYIGIAMGCPAL